MKDYMRSHTWGPHPGVDPALHAVGELRVPLRGRRNRTRRSHWVLDYSFVSGTYYRVKRSGTWQPRLAGEAHVYPPDTTFWSTSDPSFHHVSQSMYVMFSWQGRSQLHTLFKPGESYARFLDPEGILGRRLRVLVGIGVRNGEQGFWRAQAVLWRVVDLLFCHSIAGPDGDRMIVRARPGDAGADFVAQVDRFLRDRAATHVTRDDIAREMGISVSSLSHRYRALTGVSPIQRLRFFRVESAKILLRKGQPLKTVAAATGCCDEFHLSKLFKAVVGISPRRYLEVAASGVERGVHDPA